MRTRTRVLLALAAAAVTAGCSSVKCGEGTFASGNDCVPYDPNDKTAPTTTASPTGGRTRDPLPAYVTLTTDEEAEIYYTTDGSMPTVAASVHQRDHVTIVGITEGLTVTYFAVDKAGNQEAVKTATFSSDTVGPSPVTGLTVSVTGSAAHVTWTDPTDADFAGTVIARVADVVDAAPAPGTMVTTANTLSPSLKIVSVGKTGAVDDPGLPPGPVRYVAWTFDDLGNYGMPVVATGLVPIGATTGRLTITNTTVTVAQAPANLDLAMSSATVSGTTVTLALSVKNNTVQTFLNPKAEVVAIANGAFGNSDGTADAHPFKSLGGRALAPGATATATMTITGVAAGTTVTLDLAITGHDALLSTIGQLPRLGLIDLGTGAALAPLQLTSTGPNDRPNGRIRPALQVGSHYIDVPSTHGAIERFDLATGMRVGAVPIGQGDRANVQALISTGAQIFAVVKHAGRRRSGDAELIQLDEGMHILARLALPSPDDKGFSRPALAPDGHTLALALTNGILLVDLRTMTPIDTDPTTPDITLLSSGVVGVVRSIVFLPGGQNMLVLARNSGQAAVIKHGSDGYTATVYTEPPNTKGFAAALAPDGRVWLAFATGLRAYDPAADTFTPITAYTSAPHGLSMIGSQMWVIRSDRATLDAVSATGAVQRTVTLPANSVYGHWLEVAH